MAHQRFRVAAGILAAAVTLGVAELLAALFGPDTAPLNALGATVVDRTPDGLREWAITSFGTSDKTVLYLAMGAVALCVAGLAGVLERTRRFGGSALLLVLGVVSTAIVVGRAGVVGAIPTLIGVGAGIFTLRALTRRIDGMPVLSIRADHDQSIARTTELEAETSREISGTTLSDDAADGTMFERRGVLRGMLVAGGVAAVAGLGGRLLGGRTNVSGERAAVQLPTPSAAPEAVLEGTDLRVPGLTPFVTPNNDFYRIDTALFVPQVSVDSWSLRIHGMVEREIHLDWDDLTQRDAVERIVTLACVSNEVGGDLIGNARWLGYPLAELLAEARPHPDADMVLSRSTDGWTAGTPLSVLTDGRDALLAVGMNGEPLPVQHGYPARLVVPGLYGYVSATKWVTELEVTRFDRATAYWTRRGWSEQGPIKTGTRIDTPSRRKRITEGRNIIAGVAWAQHRGIRGVEVQIDNGAWQPARLAEEQSVDTWRQWVYEWDATAGPHTLRARATDGTGQTQTAQRVDVIPDGATGYPSVLVQVG